MGDLFDPRWKILPLREADFGPYCPPFLDDAAKAVLWQAQQDGTPTRTPVMYGVNNRVALLDDRVDSTGLSYATAFDNPEAFLKTQLLFDYVCRMRYNRFCDSPTELPEVWQVTIHFQNVYEAWYFGCPVHFEAGQIPGSTPIYTGDKAEAVFDIDITQPLARPPFKTAVEFYDYLVDYVADKTFLDRPIALLPPAFGTDGPLTVAMNIRGNEILTDLVMNSDYAQLLFRFIMDAEWYRRKAFFTRYDIPKNEEAGLADDSIAMLSLEQYREFVMPHHRYYYEATNPSGGKRGMHLCGDATRFFPLLHQELGVTTFDTGFPVDFGACRAALGPEVTLMGGVEVATLVQGTPEQVYARSREILCSGVLEGGRFIFREGNNLPPNVPWANLAAMYQATFDFGTFPEAE